MIAILIRALSIPLILILMNVANLPDIPSDILGAITYTFKLLYSFNNILPIDTLLTCAAIVFGIEIGIMTLKTAAFIANFIYTGQVTINDTTWIVNRPGDRMITSRYTSKRRTL